MNLPPHLMPQPGTHPQSTSLRAVVKKPQPHPVVAKNWARPAGPNLRTGSTGSGEVAAPGESTEADQSKQLVNLLRVLTGAFFSLMLAEPRSRVLFCGQQLSQPFGDQDLQLLSLERGFNSKALASWHGTEDIPLLPLSFS